MTNGAGFNAGELHADRDRARRLHRQRLDLHLTGQAVRLQPDHGGPGPRRHATCTITNDDQPATLTLVKTVTNDNGGTAVPTDWTLTATGPTPISGTTGSAR